MVYCVYSGTYGSEKLAAQSSVAKTDKHAEKLCWLFVRFIGY